MRLFRNKKRRLLALVAMLGTIAAAPQLTLADEPQPDSFPGVWSVTVTPDQAGNSDGKQPFSDEVLFENGQMSAAACAAYGFAPASYSVTGTGTTFSTTMTCGSETIVWSASAGGSGFVGTVTWTKPDGQVFHYTLRGARFTAEAAEEGSSSGSN